jgi:hypothetical protein
VTKIKLERRLKVATLNVRGMNAAKLRLIE